MALVRAARQVKRLTLDALRQSDLYFAWLDTPCALPPSPRSAGPCQRKIIWLAGPQAFDELWLAYTWPTSIPSVIPHRLTPFRAWSSSHSPTRRSFRCRAGAVSSGTVATGIA